MFTDDEQQAYSESQPKTSEEILWEVGLTPEELVGKKVLFFGDGKMKLSVEGVDIRDGQPEVFDMFEDEEGNPIVVPIPDLNSFDLILGRDSGDLNTHFDNDHSVAFMMATLSALSDGGEIRVPTIEWLHAETEEIADREKYYDRFFDYSGFDITTRIHVSKQKEQAYFVITRNGRVDDDQYSD